MSDRFWKRIDYLVGLLPIGALFGLVAYAANIEVKDLDLWLHLATGRYIVLHQYIPTTDVLSAAISGQFWNNHEWLFQVIIYHIHHLWGFDGLLQMQVVLVVLTMLFLLFLGYSKDNQLLTTFGLLMVYLVYSGRFTVRPDLFSLFFFTIYIFVLALHIDKRWGPFVLVVVQVLWTNMHGFFFFGPLFVLIGLISEWMKRHVPLPAEWNESGRLDDTEYKRLKIVFALVCVACLVNPQFIEGAIYPLTIFFSMSGENKIFFDYIEELRKPILWSNIFDTTKYSYYKLLIFLSAISFVFNRRRIDISAFFFWLVFLIFSLKAVRNLSFFAFAAYLVIITNCVNISWSSLVPLRFTQKKFKYLTSIVLKLLILVWILQYTQAFVVRSYYDFDKYEFKSEFGGVSLRSYPRKGVDFLVENKVKGNIFNDFNSGAYLLGRTHPDIKVYIDGRTEAYGGEFFKRYTKIWTEGDAELFEEAVDQYQLTAAFLNSSRQHIPEKILNYLYDHQDWMLVYFDFDAVIFLKNTEENKSLIGQFEIDLSRWESKPIDLQRLGPHGVMPYEPYYRAYTLESLGFHDAALEEARNSIRTMPSYAEPYQLIGKIYASQKNYLKAFESFRIAVIGKKRDKQTRLNLALAYMDLENYSGATEEYKRIVNMWPQELQPKFLLSKAYAKDGQSDEAVTTLRLALAADPDAVGDIVLIGDILVEQKAYSQALEVYENVEVSGKGDASLYQKLGDTYQVSGEIEKAQEAFEKGLAIDPENEELQKALSKLPSEVEG